MSKTRELWRAKSNDHVCLNRKYSWPLMLVDSTPAGSPVVNLLTALLVCEGFWLTLMGIHRQEPWSAKVSQVCVLSHWVLTLCLVLALNNTSSLYLLWNTMCFCRYLSIWRGTMHDVSQFKKASMCVMEETDMAAKFHTYELWCSCHRTQCQCVSNLC